MNILDEVKALGIPFKDNKWEIIFLANVTEICISVMNCFYLLNIKSHSTLLTKDGFKKKCMARLICSVKFLF